MALTRRELLGGAAGAAVAGSGIYALVDKLTQAPQRSAAGPLTPEQHLLDGIPVVTDNGVEVLVPPLHHQIVTAKLAVDESPSALRDAQAELEHTLANLDSRFEPTPAGLGVTVAWGLPYFRRYLGKNAARHLPVDRRASAARGRRVSVLEDAARFPSDPDTTILEDNDVAVLLRSDSLDNIAHGSKGLFGDPGGIFRVTSVRKGFAGGGFGGARSLPKQMAVAAGVPGAELIPDTAELFFGFTSTSKAALGPPKIANFETLGYVDLGPKGLLAGGTHMHLSHIFEDLAAWYLTFDFQARVDTTFRPGLAVRDGTQTIAQAPVTHRRREPSSGTTHATAGSATAGRSRPRRACSTRSSGRTGPVTRRARQSLSGPTSTRWTILSSSRPTPNATVSSSSRRPASTSSSSTRRATTFVGTGSRWTAFCPTGRPSASTPIRPGRASTRCSRPRTDRTFSSRHGGSVPFRSRADPRRVASGPANCA